MLVSVFAIIQSQQQNLVRNTPEDIVRILECNTFNNVKLREGAGERLRQ